MKSAEHFFDEQATEDQANQYIYGLHKIPFVLRKDIYELMEEYAKEEAVYYHQFCKFIMEDKLSDEEAWFKYLEYKNNLQK